MMRILVAIPNYNNRDYICEAIYSVLNQKIENLDVVVFDNASVDGVVELVNQEFGGAVKVFSNAINVGGVKNHNFCIEYAQANNYDYLKLLSSDDVLIEGALVKEIDLLDRNPGAAFVNCNMLVVNEKLELQQEVYFSGSENPGRLNYGSVHVKQAAKRLENIFGAPSGLLMRVAVIKKVKFDASYRWISDLKFASELAVNSYFINSGNFGFYYRRHSATDSKSLNSRFFLKTIEFLRYSIEFGGGLSGAMRSILLFFRNLSAAMKG